MRKKRILVLTGSARKRGNTLTLTEEFIKAAEKNDCEVVRFDTVSLKVGCCHGCETCFKNGMPCSFDDDFNEVARAMMDADAVLFSFPLYFASVPAKMKAVIDKFYCFFTTGKCKGKEWGVISCCNQDDPEAFAPALAVVKDAAYWFQWHFVGELLVPGMGPAGAVRGTPAMEQAAALADAFVNPAVRRR